MIEYIIGSTGGSCPGEEIMADVNDIKQKTKQDIVEDTKQTSESINTESPAEQMAAKKKKTGHLMVRVGTTIFLIFALLTILFGVFLVHISRDYFFTGQQDSLKAQLKQLQEIINEYPYIEWLTECWEKYPEEMRKEITEEEREFVAITSFDPNLDERPDIKEVEKYSFKEQMAIAKMTSLDIAFQMMVAMAQTGDRCYLMDISEGREGKVYLDLPPVYSPMEMLGEEYPELLVGEDLWDKLRSYTPKTNEIVFVDHKSEDGNYLYQGYAAVFYQNKVRFVVVLVHEWTEDHKQMIQSILWTVGIQAAILGIFGALLVLLISTAAVGPVKRLRYGVKRYTKEKSFDMLREDLSIIKQKDEFGELVGDITDMAEEIDRYMDENIRLAREREAAAAELQIASRVQKEQLPSGYPDNPCFTLRAFIRPAKEVGGDFYDFFLPDENHLVILIADVSDKGMNAAFFMAISKAMIKANAMKTLDPAKIVTGAEQMLTENNPGGMFVTLWLGVVDLTTGHVEACNAGHDYPAIRKNGVFETNKTPHGPAVSFLPGIPHIGYSFDLEPGDRIFLYTDGVVEALGKNEERFGVSRLCDTLNSSTEGEDDQQTIDKMIAAVDAFAGDTPQFDDITMLCFTYRAEKHKDK